MRTRVVAFTTSYTGRTNVLKNEVQISQAFDPLSAPKLPKLKKFIAIWDTGATSSVITQKVASDCGLKPIGMAKVHHAKGETTTPVYLASIFLPNKVVIPQLREMNNSSQITNQAEPIGLNPSQVRIYMAFLERQINDILLNNKFL